MGEFPVSHSYTYQGMADWLEEMGGGGGGDGASSKPLYTYRRVADRLEEVRGAGRVELQYEPNT